MKNNQKSYDEKLKFRVVNGEHNSVFQANLQTTYNEIIEAGHIIKDIKFFTNNTGYDAIILYSNEKEKQSIAEESYVPWWD